MGRATAKRGNLVKDFFQNMSADGSANYVVQGVLGCCAAAEE